MCWGRSILIFVCISATASNEITQTVKPVLRTCFEEFVDLRNSTTEDIVLTVPGNLTNGEAYEKIDFYIQKLEHELPCASSFYKTVKWEEGRDFIRIKSKIKGDRLRNSGKVSTHFTQDGHFHFEGHYYSTDDFCITSVSDTAIGLKICNVSCEDSSKICIPKCCGPDEILTYWNFTCRKITTDESKWKAKIHYQVYPHVEITDPKELGKVHIYRKRLDCQKFDNWPLTDTIRARNKTEWDWQVAWKMLPTKRPIFLTRYRKWEHIPEGDFCVDGFANWGYGGNGTYSGNEDVHSVLLFCPASNYTGPPFEAWKAWTYSTILVISSVFLVLTAVVHVLLLDRQHLHGLTVLCHSTSMFFMYIFCAIAHIVSINPALKGPKPRGKFCLSIAILSHYFFMTSFTWLTIMNFDLWLTFRSMRPVSKMSRRIRRFRLYSAIGWGIPLILSCVFYTIDHIYRDRKTEVVVPDYADQNCFVAIWSRGYYMYSLLAIALSINTVLVLWTFYIFYEFRQQNANTFTTKRAKSDKYSVRLFIKLFCVMGVAWFVELLSWYYNGEAKPKVVVVLDCIMFFQSAAIFFIFCINRRTLKQLEDKYQCLKGVIGPIRRFRWFNYSEAEGVEMTTPGSTPRKLSLSVTNNTRMDSTLPRKTSSSSLRSGSSSGKYIVNGTVERMESINLDSEVDSKTVLESHKDNKDFQHTPDILSNT